MKTLPTSLLFWIFASTLLTAQPKVSFRGIHLGMSLEEVRTLIDTGNLELGTAQELEPSGSVMLQLEDRAGWSDPEFDLVGCKSVGSQTTCYRLSSVHVDFHKGYVYGITLSSQSIETQYVDMLNDCIEATIVAIQERYGKPTKSRRLPAPQSALDSAEYDRKYPRFAQWLWTTGKKKKELASIEVYISHSTGSKFLEIEDYYMVWIKMIDEVRSEEKYKEEERQREHEEEQRNNPKYSTKF